MSYQFTKEPLRFGYYEPEGIYLSTPFRGPAALLQLWGENPDYYGQFTYNGVLLKGHPGIDFGLEPDTPLVAVDTGRVMELSAEPGGFERYIKLEHSWGESFYSYVGTIAVDSGQQVYREETIGTLPSGRSAPQLLHFTIRIHPFNRFDGWGGFTDPLPFLDPLPFQSPNQDLSMGADTEKPIPPHPMVVERPGMRRP